MTPYKQGYTDAKNGLPPGSMDSQYLAGYNAGMMERGIK